MPTPTETLLGRLNVEGAAIEWARAEARSVGVAWATCPRADWLVDLAARLEVDRRLVVRAASDCVALALPLAASEPLARDAWATARRWVEEKATSAECWADGAAVREAAEPYAESQPSTAAALLAVAHLAFACDDRAEAGYWAGQGHAAEAVRHAVHAGGDAAGRHAADLVRDHVPYETVARVIALVLRTPRRSGVLVSDPSPVEERPSAEARRRL